MELNFTTEQVAALKYLLAKHSPNTHTEVCTLQGWLLAYVVAGINIDSDTLLNTFKLNSINKADQERILSLSHQWAAVLRSELLQNKRPSLCIWEDEHTGRLDASHLCIGFLSAPSKLYLPSPSNHNSAESEAYLDLLLPIYFIAQPDGEQAKAAQISDQSIEAFTETLAERIVQLWQYHRSHKPQPPSEP